MSAAWPVAGDEMYVEQDEHGRRVIHAGACRTAIHQVYYNRASGRRLHPYFTPYFNEHATPFLESSVLARLLAEGAHRHADYFGVVSWRIAAKIPLPPRRWIERMRADGYRADAYSFFGRLGAGRVWPRAERKHPGIMRAAAVLFSRLGLDLDLRELSAPLVYQNHVICRSEVYARFGAELLTPALDAMARTEDGMLQALLGVDAQYGVDRGFTLHPFIAERLFSTWLALHPAVTLTHLWRGRFVDRDAAAQEPELHMAEGE